MRYIMEMLSLALPSVILMSCRQPPSSRFAPALGTTTKYQVAALLWIDCVLRLTCRSIKSKEPVTNSG